MSVKMDINKYLARIGYSGKVETTLDTLRTVHNCHLLSIPFENLTLHSGGRVQLDLQRIYNKVVNQRRGGFCFENNSLFSWLLSQMGFEITMLSGQVRNSITCRYGPPFDHLIVMVILEGQRWLCDVGFGPSGFCAPISLESSEPQKQGHRLYRVRKDGGMYFLELQEKKGLEEDGEWMELYKFTLEPRGFKEFAEMCDYHQSSPSSLFYCKSLCCIHKLDGKVTYVGHKLTITTYPTDANGSTLEVTTNELKDEEIPAMLKEQFGVVLNSPLVPKDEAITPPPITY